MNKDEIFLKICERISTSDIGVAKLCKEFNTSTVTFYNWIDASEENLKQYTRAREAQADYLADQILEIADDSSNDRLILQKGKQKIEVENTEFVNRSKLRVEARKWVAAKLKPRKYSDKMDITSGNEKIQQANPELLQSIAAQIVKNSHLSSEKG